ncbi:hypothetical protein JCM17823_17770 [Halorubrum gandharaense]
MRIRDALESDAEALARLADRPTEVMADLVHERSVRVAVAESAAGSGETDGAGADSDVGGKGDASGADGATGFLAFDVHADAVHVTDFAGSRAATDRLFEEPRRFAAREGMVVEAVVADGDDEGSAAVEAAGFEHVGPGPRFEGRPTSRYRLDPDGKSDGVDDHD